MTVLDDIIAGVRADLEQRQARVSHTQIVSAATAAPAPLPLLPNTGFGLICEVKRSSPSKGALADIPDPAALAAQYEAGGAAAISVLTEKHRFGGSLADLTQVRAAVSIPILRKDFTVTDYQIYEARAYGADLILLMVCALDDAQLRDFLQLTHELGMTALVEVHTRAELERARELNPTLLGINTRNLKDLSVDPQRFAQLAAHTPTGATLVAESGVNSVAQIEQYARAGAQLVLTGEALVKAGDASASVQEFTSAGWAIHQETNNEGRS